MIFTNIRYKMIISEYKKSQVIQAWLMGKSRETIASQFHISTGTVSNIVDQWRNMIGSYDATSLRELALGLKKSGSSSVQCLNGLRIINLINQLGIDEDHVYDFLNKLYLGCRDQGVQSYEVASLVKEINAFPEINSIKEIPGYIKERSSEKRKLDMEIYFARHELENLNSEKIRKKIEIQNLQKDLESFKEMNRNEQKDFLLFKDLKNELEKNNIFMQDFEQLINIIRIFKDDFKYQPIEILNEFSDIQNYRYLRDNKNRQLNEIQILIRNAQSQLDTYKQWISLYQKEEDALTSLQNMEFNLPDFTKLYSVLQDIALKYQIGIKEVKTKFFELLDQFVDSFSLHIEIAEKRNEVFVLENKINSKRKILKDQPELFSAVNDLLEKGYNESSSLSAFEIIKKDFLNGIPNDIKSYLEDLSKDLDKYKTRRNTIKSLDMKILIKKCQVDRLSSDKRNLERHPQIHRLSIDTMLNQIQDIQKALP